MIKNGEVVYWLPKYADMEKYKDYCRAGYPIKTFFRVILPEWLKTRPEILTLRKTI